MQFEEDAGKLCMFYAWVASFAWYLVRSDIVFPLLPKEEMFRVFWLTASKGALLGHAKGLSSPVSHSSLWFPLGSLQKRDEDGNPVPLLCPASEPESSHHDQEPVVDWTSMNLGNPLSKLAKLVAITTSHDSKFHGSSAVCVKIYF